MWRQLLRPGPRRIEHNRREAVELGLVERAAEQVAMVDEQTPSGGLQRKRGIARALRRIDFRVERQREGAEAGEQIGDDRRIATFLPPSVTVAGSGSQIVCGPKPSSSASRASFRSRAKPIIASAASSPSALIPSSSRSTP